MEELSDTPATLKHTMEQSKRRLSPREVTVNPAKYCIEIDDCPQTMMYCDNKTRDDKCVYAIQERRFENETAERLFAIGSVFTFRVSESPSFNDAAEIVIPQGACLKINTASVCEDTIIEAYLTRGNYLTLYLSSEENEEMTPICPFTANPKTSKTSDICITNLGIEVSGPRTIKLAAKATHFGVFTSAFINLVGSVVPHPN